MRPLKAARGAASLKSARLLLARLSARLSGRSHMPPRLCSDRFLSRPPPVCPERREAEPLALSSRRKERTVALSCCTSSRSSEISWS